MKTQEFKPGDRIEQQYGIYSQRPTKYIWKIGTFVRYDPEEKLTAWVIIDENQEGLIDPSVPSVSTSFIVHLRRASVLDELAWALRDDSTSRSH